MNPKKLLVVEDDVAIAEGLADYLQQQEYELDFAYRGDHALDLLKEQTFDLILLDLNLPGKSGLHICQHIKADNDLSAIPVLMMTANKQLDTKLEGFEAGAWDYLEKPFSFKELEARIKVLLKMSNLSKKATYTGLSFADISINAGGTSASVEGQPIKLTGRGLTILTRLLESAPDPVGHAELTRALWGDDTPDSDPLRAHIYQVRQRLNKVSRKAQIVLIKGIGYCLKEKQSI